MKSLIRAAGLLVSGAVMGALAMHCAHLQAENTALTNALDDSDMCDGFDCCDACCCDGFCGCPDGDDEGDDGAAAEPACACSRDVPDMPPENAGVSEPEL